MSSTKFNGRILLSGCLILNDKKEILLLYRKDHHHYETPGGKVRKEECTHPNDPTIDDLAKTAEREVYEELGSEIKIETLKYFTSVEFTTPDGRLAHAHKFLTKIHSGTPHLNEPEQFSKLEYLPLRYLEDYPLSPDLRLLLAKVKGLAGNE